MTHGISKFWTRWLLIATSGMIIMGLALTFTPLAHVTVGATYYNNYFNYDAYSAISDGDLRFQTFLYGVSGAVMASWSILMFFLVLFPLRKGQKWAWFAMTLSLMVWFVGDGYASVATGFAVHAALNLSLLILLGIPLAATYRQMH